MHSGRSALQMTWKWGGGCTPGGTLERLHRLTGRQQTQARKPQFFLGVGMKPPCQAFFQDDSTGRGVPPLLSACPPQEGDWYTQGAW